METRKINYIKKLSPILFIFILTILFFYPVIFQGKTFYAFDALLEYLPWSSYQPDFRANNSLITDPVNEHFAYHHLLKKSVREKTLPFWDASVFCGVPLAASCFSRYSDPIVSFFYVLFPLPTAHDWVLWFHLLGIGIFMFLYLKEIGLKTCPALIGSVSWMFSGYVMVWFEFEMIPILAVSLPAALYFAERWLKTRAKFYCLGFTGAAALSVCSGFAHGAIYQFLFIASYLLYRYISERKKHADFPKIGRRELSHLMLVVLLGISISAVFLTTHLALFGVSQRPQFDFDDLYQQTGQLPPTYLSTMIFPDFFGNPARGISFIPRIKGGQPYNNYNELCIYMGIFPLFLAFACLPHLFKRRDIAFFLFSAILPLTMAMGSLLYYPLVKLIPGLSFSSPTRILYIFAFSMSVLAGTGADILLTVKDEKKWSVILLWVLLSGGAAGLSFFVQTEAGIQWAANADKWPNWNQIHSIFKTHFAPWSPVMLKPLVLVFVSFLVLSLTLFSRKERSKIMFLLLGAAVLSYDLISFGLLYNTASPKSLAYPPTDAVRFLKEDKSHYRIITYGKFLHNSFAPFDIEDAGGYGSFYPKRYGEFLHLSQYGPDAPLPENFSRWIFFKKFGSPLFDLINTKYLLFPPSSALIRSPRLSLVYDREIKIYENREVFPRSFFVPTYQFCKTREAAYQALGAYSGADLKRRVILESRPPQDFQEKGMAWDGEINAKTEIISYGPNRMEIDVTTDQKGFLVLSDSYHSGWRAEVNGEKTEVLRANYIMKAVPMGKGNHRVVLTFQPRLLSAGVVITIVGWLTLFGLMGLEGLKKQTRQT